MLARNNLYYLGLDVVAKIISYLEDPRDLEALYQADPWLTTNIYDRCVTHFYIDPDYIIPIDYTILYKYSNLVSARCDIKIDYKLDLYHLLARDIKELCIRISSSKGPSLISTIKTLLASNMLTEYKYRLERYNPVDKYLDNIWIGDGKLAVSNSSIFSYIMLYRNYIEELVIDVSLWNNPNALEILVTLPRLINITYLEFGYYPCNALELYSMLNINDYIQSINCLLCSFDYSIDPENIWTEIDDLILLCNGQTYPSINKLYLPLNYQIYSDNIHNIFPNLIDTGCRYIHDITITDINNFKNTTTNTTTTTTTNTNSNVISLDSFNHLWNTYLKDFNRVKIFLYIVVTDMEARKLINRDSDIKQDISFYILNIIANYSWKIEVVNASYPSKSLIKSLDDWLFY